MPKRKLSAANGLPTHNDAPTDPSGRSTGLPEPVPPLAYGEYPPDHGLSVSPVISLEHYRLVNGWQSGSAGHDQRRG